MICFGILVHEKMDVVANQVSNFKRFNPDAKIVFYNGSSNEKFSSQLKEYAKKVKVPICSYSKPIENGKLGRVILDLATYLENSNITYDYFVYADSDVMFVKKNFEAYLNRVMMDYDFMGIDTWLEYKPDDSENKPAKTLWKEWDKWQPFFETNYFCRTLNTNQVYRSSIIKKILSSINRKQVEGLIKDTNVDALEEFLFATLAVKNGAARRSYPKNSANYVWLDIPMTVGEIKQAKAKKDVYFVHPVKRSMSDAARFWITQN